MSRLAWILTPAGSMRAWAIVVMLIAGFGLALGLTIGYVNKVDRASERRNVERAREICGLIEVFDDAYAQNPPTTPTGKRAAAEMHAYRLKLGC